MKKIVMCFIFLGMTGCASQTPKEENIAISGTLLDEIQIAILDVINSNSPPSYGPILGAWTGSYFVENGPDELFVNLAKDGVDKSGIGIRIELEQEQTRVFFKFSPNRPWEETDGAIQLIPDKLGWHIFIAREGGVWLERLWISVARTGENSGTVVVTRTVHNWFNEEDSGEPDTYYMFGAGQVNKM